MSLPFPLLGETEGWTIRVSQPGAGKKWKSGVKFPVLLGECLLLWIDGGNPGFRSWNTAPPSSVLQVFMLIFCVCVVFNMGSKPVCGSETCQFCSWHSGRVWCGLVYEKEKKNFFQGMPLSEVTPGVFTSAMVTDLLDWWYSHAGNNARKTGFARLRLRWPKNSRKWLYSTKPSVLG